MTINIQTQLLRATFLTNMEALKERMPSVYDFYKTYKSQDTSLTIDGNGRVNLVSNGGLVYDGDPRELSREQVELFASNPKVFNYQMTGFDQIYFEHQVVIKSIIDKSLKETRDKSNIQIEVPWQEPQLDFFCMIGAGLGYQIEELFLQKDIKHFFLYEPSPDVLFAALHTIDFLPLIKKCNELGGSFTIKIGGNETEFVNEVYRLFRKHGFYNLTRIFLYRHYLSEDNTNAFSLFHQLSYRYSSGWGFCEDEFISFIHTYANLKANYPILTRQNNYKNKLDNLPVLILANGPSLDDAFDFIREHKENFILISCGTALGSLLKQDIMPDVHIEMERTARLLTFIDALNVDPEILKKIPIVALNPVYDKLLEKFKQAHVMLKINDAGSNLVTDLVGKEQYPYMEYCNPTVMNAATSFVSATGFKSCYLIGTDLGFVDEEHHHSKSSIYYDKSWGEQEEADKRQKSLKSGLPVKGNFRDEVYTTQAFDSSKGVLEFLAMESPHLEFFNCSDGVLVAGTKPKKLTDIIVDKSNIKADGDVEEFLSSAFKATNCKPRKVEKFIQGKFTELRHHIDKIKAFTTPKITSRAHLSLVFGIQYDYLESLSKHAGTMINYRFLKGTIYYFQACIMTYSYPYMDREMQVDFINDSLDEMHNHLEFLYDEMVNGYDKPSKI